MKPGAIYGIPIVVEATGNLFLAGHRIRVEVTSSNFPRFDRNLNTGGKNYDETEWHVARNTIHHSGEYASYITLPVVTR
jgi:putative CocE/NonD family hydrolase